LAYRRFRRSRSSLIKLSVAGKNTSDNFDAAKLVGFLHVVVTLASQGFSDIRAQRIVGFHVVLSSKIEQFSDTWHVWRSCQCESIPSVIFERIAPSHLEGNQVAQVFPDATESSAILISGKASLPIVCNFVSVLEHRYVLLSPGPNSIGPDRTFNGCGQGLFC
jgi:hypothetical protein